MCACSQTPRVGLCPRVVAPCPSCCRPAPGLVIAQAGCQAVYIRRQKQQLAGPGPQPACLPVLPACLLPAACVVHGSPIPAPPRSPKGACCSASALWARGPCVSRRGAFSLAVVLVVVFAARGGFRNAAAADAHARPPLASECRRSPRSRTAPLLAPPPRRGPASLGVGALVRPWVPGTPRQDTPPSPYSVVEPPRRWACLSASP